jgi:hypothetical protein
MLHALEREEAAVDQGMGGVAFEVREKTDAAGVMLEVRIVEAAARPLGYLVAVVHANTPSISASRYTQGTGE